jgi:hypothetical protein
MRAVPEQQRLQPRVPVSKAAKIALDNGTKIECVVVNRSSGGVCIEADSPTRIPESFVLTMGTDINRVCHVRWRLGKRLGLAFE